MEKESIWKFVDRVQGEGRCGDGRNIRTCH